MKKKKDFRKFARASARRQAPRRTPAPKKNKTHAAVTVNAVFCGTRYGYGFAEVEGRGEDLFIPERKTGGAMHGDRIRVRFTPQYEGRQEGEVVAITEYAHTTLVGILAAEETIFRRRRVRRYFVIPDNPHFGEAYPAVYQSGYRVGHKVEVSLGRDGESAGTLLRDFGDAESRGANYGAILSENGIETEFTEDALREAELAASTPLSEAGRTRVRDVVFTIDGADAKDLDDAISLRRVKGGYLLGVHIADVSEYVKPKGELDAAAHARGTSVYFTDKVVPMLPPALSNGACSLNAGEDKYALSATVQLDQSGKIVDCRIEKSILRSRVRGVYSEVNDLLENREASAFYEKYKGVYPTLLEMTELYLILDRRSRARGAMELDRAEARILLDESGEPVEIVARERGVAEKMIEQFMLAANEAVATRMHALTVPCVYRVHEEPSPDRLREFVTFAHNLDFDTRPFSERRPTGRDFSDLLDTARERGIGDALSYTVLRTMAKAKYSAAAHPHFGLGIPLYCHFTSPIRRLSDLVTHRIIKAVLLDGEPAKRYESAARRAADAATEGELRALAAERGIDALYKTVYMTRHIGEEFDAVISSVTSFGIFAELQNTCEGLIPLSSLDGAFVFDERNLSVHSGRTVYRLGDRIRVRVVDADVPSRRVRFAIVAQK
ncbi:MAG: VacB/RNase II family 3'-5' exoribonuclease [Clostridia bacterium]|nr:VacB/RNase II family 3'-5' exoribonuclease [Clostridia bacterium]